MAELFSTGLVKLVVLGHTEGAQSDGSLPGGLIAAWWEGVKAWIGQMTGGGKVAAPAALKPQMAIHQKELTINDPPTGQIYRSYYFVGSVRVGMREFTGSVSVVSYIVTDHLGSTSLTLDASGIVVNTMLYKPWGETRYSYGPSSTDCKYTGQLSLDIGIYHYGARAYDPYLNRSLQPDSILPNPNNPLDWDRYSYVRNNPVNAIDPTGHETVICGITCEENGGSLRTPGLTVQDPIGSITQESIDAAVEAYGESVSYGLNFIYQLRKNKGWWTKYITGTRDTFWKFILSMAYSIESYSAHGTNIWLGDPSYREFMIDTVINKSGTFFNQNGYAGLLAFIGGRQALRVRTYPDGSDAWKEGTDAYHASWDLTWLPKIGVLLDDAKNNFIDKAWSLITNYTGTDMYGTGAYDYGQSPPLIIDPQKVIWQEGSQYVIKK